jgi:hypothetical protein
MYPLIQTLLFINSKWNLSMDEFKPIGKFLFFIPNYLNNILTQIYYYLLSPFIYIYFVFENDINMMVTMFRLFMLKFLSD